MKPSKLLLAGFIAAAGAFLLAVGERVPGKAKETTQPPPESGGDWGFNDSPAERIARMAVSEMMLWGDLTEDDPGAQPMVQKYWADLYDPQPGEAWSAAFVQWACNAAVPGSLAKASNHIVYATSALKWGGRDSYQTFKPEEITNIQVGDILIRTRPNVTPATWEDIEGAKVAYSHGDIVVGVDAHGVDVIGGNLSNRVESRRHPRDGGEIIAVLRYLEA